MRLDDDRFTHALLVIVAVLLGIVILVAIGRATDEVNKKADCILVNACQEVVK